MSDYIYNPARMVAAAQRYHAAGLSCIPIAADGSKSPYGVLSTWTQWKERRPNPSLFPKWWAAGHGPRGIAIIAGAVSGHLEVLDFDHLDRFHEWSLHVHASEWGPYLARLPLVETPSGGWHLYYRVAQAHASTKLARSPERKTWIELKGEGGYVLAPPSPPQCHPSGGRYRFDRNRPPIDANEVWDIPIISNNLREVLFGCARLLDQAPAPVLPPMGSRQRRVNESGHRAGDLYNAQPNAIIECLQRHGWKVVGGTRRNVKLLRPGKSEKGCSATWNGQKFWVWSSNATPFEPETAYEPFTVYAMLEFGGDFKAAAKNVYETHEKA